MASGLSSHNAKRISEKASALIESTKRETRYKDELFTTVVKTSNALVAQELLKVLRTIPVEELNREKKGIKTKTLRDNGYQTIADVHAASLYNLSAINGISRDSAATIKRIAGAFVEQTSKNVKIKLSLDDKNLASNNLVLSVYAFLHCTDIVEEFHKILFDYEETVKENLEDLSLRCKKLSWFFASKSKKLAAEEAYNCLTNMLNGDLGNRCRAALYSLEKLQRTDIDVAWDDFAKNSVKYFNVIEAINPGVLGTNDAVYGLPEDLAREIQDECFFPDGLKCELRAYQEWGVKYILHQEKVLLGDEMGLGKTIQAIAAMVSLKNTGATHFVVICPASVLTNWYREIRKHSLLSATIIHGYHKVSAFHSWLKTGGVAVTTYETTSVFRFEDDFKFSMLVVDEAHYIKNPNTHRTKNTIELSKQTDRVLFMTGTPLENNVEEMIWLISNLRPAIANRIKSIAFMATAPQFREEIAPVYYRRKREDVLSELPDLIEKKEWCTIQGEEENLYENAVLSKNFSEARRISWNVSDLKNSCKAQRMLEIIEQAESEGRKVIVFSFFLDTIFKIHAFLGSRCLNPIYGAVTPERRQEILDEFEKAPAGSVLVSQIQSGGTGLNIQCASVVIICEPQFKPSTENQAISRAYRMGQTRNVQVFRLLCENTVDERVTDILEQKQAEFNAFADKSVAGEQHLEEIKLSETKFGELINEEIERIKKKNNSSESIDSQD